jgi:hypothetical protein
MVRQDVSEDPQALQLSIRVRRMVARLLCWFAGHQWREVQRWGAIAYHRCDRCSAERMKADPPGYTLRAGG